MNTQKKHFMPSCLLIGSLFGFLMHFAWAATPSVQAEEINSPQPTAAPNTLTTHSSEGPAVEVLVANPFEGRYEEVKPPQPTANPNKVEVIKFFWYACPHCYYFNNGPAFQQWKAKKPDYVDFRYVPAVFSAEHRSALLAEAYYMAETADIVDKIHIPLFEAIHLKRQYELIYDRTALQYFFEQYGVGEDHLTDDQLTQLWKSAHAQLQQAIELTQGYELSSVPNVFVNGRYRLVSDHPDKMIETLNYLIEKERKRMGLPK